MSEKSIKNPSGSYSTFAPSLILNRSLPHEKFSRNCWRLSSVSLHQEILILYISYTLDTWSRDLNTDKKNMNILVMVLDSMNLHNFHCQTVAGVKMSLFLELIIVLLCMLIIKKYILELLAKLNTRIRWY